MNAVEVWDRLDDVQRRIDKLERQHARAIDANRSPYLRTLSTGAASLDGQLKDWLEGYLRRHKALSYERDVLNAALAEVPT